MRQTEQPSLKNLEAVLGHHFRHGQLLVQALTHSSLAYERSTELESAQATDSKPLADAADNEQLEFLGDAVVGLLVAEFLYKHYPELQEGELTRLRANLVSRRHLGNVAGKLQLGEYMQLGKGEERSGGRKKNALLANCIEAVIGALYLDAGLATARNFLEREIVTPYIDELRGELGRGNNIGDHKSALQEFLQAQKHGQPEYVVKAESGPDHRKRFLVEVRLSDNGRKVPPLARGIGTTKKKAEQEAARRAYEKLQGQRAVREPRVKPKDRVQTPAGARGEDL
jgi:ribonuclease III